MGISIIGTQFDRWTVIDVAPRNKYYQLQYTCQCTCGKIKIVTFNRLQLKTSKSCGCLAKEMSSIRNSKHGMAKHGKDRTSEYFAWVAMKSRCNNPTNKSYKDYGGRGINVCERWTVFENFILDMGLKHPGMSLDRINNNLGYSPDNCRWATHSEQNRNTRGNKLIEHNGQILPMIEWVIISGMSYSTFLKRYKRGWSIDKILMTPLKVR